MIVITEELIDQLVKEYKQLTENYVRDEIIQSIKDNCIGLHIDEKDAIYFFASCYWLYIDAYNERREFV